VFEQHSCGCKTFNLFGFYTKIFVDYTASLVNLKKVDDLEEMLWKSEGKL